MAGASRLGDQAVVCFLYLIGSHHKWVTSREEKVHLQIGNMMTLMTGDPTAWSPLALATTGRMFSRSTEVGCVWGTASTVLAIISTHGAAVHVPIAVNSLFTKGLEAASRDNHQSIHKFCQHTSCDCHGILFACKNTPHSQCQPLGRGDSINLVLAGLKKCFEVAVSKQWWSWADMVKFMEDYYLFEISDGHVDTACNSVALLMI